MYALTIFWHSYSSIIPHPESCSCTHLFYDVQMYHEQKYREIVVFYIFTVSYCSFEEIQAPRCVSLCVFTFSLYANVARTLQCARLNWFVNLYLCRLYNYTSWLHVSGHAEGWGDGVPGRGKTLQEVRPATENCPQRQAFTLAWALITSIQYALAVWYLHTIRVG